ncbi:MAG: transglycosylase family protein [Actinomycetes bacterium]
MLVAPLTERVATLRALGVIALGTSILAAGVVTTATPASAADGRSVTLTVDGVSTTLRTTAPTVRDLLTEQGVDYDSSDIVSPGYSSDIFGGMAVSWTPATRVYVRKNGKRSAHKVVSNTVRQVRSELELPTVGDQTFGRLETYAYENALLYGPGGRQLAADEKVREESVAVVHRIRVTFPDDTLRIKRKVVNDHSKLVRSGGKRIYRDGRNGRKRVVFKKRFIDGNLASKQIVKSRVVKESKRRVVRVGTGPNWVGLANCESGGNPNAVNPSGFYGLYQFSLSTWRAVGGKGNPTDYGYWEQTKRAWKLYKVSGRSPWPHCGSRL